MTARPTKIQDKLASAKEQERVSFWFARIWQGMTLPIWMRLLARHRFAIHRKRLPITARITLFSIFNSALGVLEKIRFEKRIRATPLQQPPLFVIGHWRTGTTWLHELLALDERFTCPTTYQCAAPHHFLLTQDWLPHLLRHMMPPQRPMDNMAAGWDRPQEDEFALCNLGLGSPYLRWAFSNEKDLYAHYLDMHNVPGWELRRWEREFVHFLKHLSVFDRRRIVLKSPTHTARVRLLNEMFPQAQFIHIVRDPYVVYASTLRLWKRLWDIMGLQVPHYRGLEDDVFDTFTRMYRQFNEEKAVLKKSQLCEIRYEDLKKDVVGEMQRIYDHLQLGEFERVKPKLKKYAEETKDYRTNRFELPEELRERIANEWREYIERYGYDV